MADRAAPTATDRLGAQRCQSRRQRRVARSDAPVALDNLAPSRQTVRTAARQRPRRDEGRAYGWEASLALSSLIVFCTRKPERSTWRERGRAAQMMVWARRQPTATKEVPPAGPRLG